MMRILRAAVDALVEEFRPRHLECLESSGERVDLIADVLIQRLGRGDASREHRQGLPVIDEVIAMA